MKKEEKEDIIYILTEWRNMIGVDRINTDKLIDIVSDIYIQEPVDIQMLNVIMEDIQGMCDELKYDIKENKRRGPVTSAKRMAIYKALEMKYGRTSSLDIAMQTFFKKHRTTLTYWRTTGNGFIDTKDKMFIEYVDKLLT
jgi:hypothetical protein